jgi:hypothetical protein
MEREHADWLREVQQETAEWRAETIGDVTAATQAAHTATEAAEALDLVVKDETYAEGMWADAGRVKELGDVVVANLGTMTELDTAPTANVDGSDVTHEPLDAVGTVLADAATVLDIATRPDPGAAGWQAQRLLVTHDAACAALGLSQRDCVEAALAKNGARNWAQHKREDEA